MPNNKYYYLTDSQHFFLRAGDSLSINLRLKGLKNRYNTIIAGRILEEELPIEYAAVIIMDEDFNELYKASTDVNGIFLFKEIVAPFILFKAEEIAISFCFNKAISL